MKNKKLRENYQWIFLNEEKLRKKFPNKYIAVTNKSVRFVSGSIEEMKKEIIAANKEIFNYAIQYITEKPINFLF